MDNKEKIQIFNYKGTVISFENSAEGKFISATQMVKAFKGKRIQEFFRLKQTLEYINELNNHLNQEELEIPPELSQFSRLNTQLLARAYPKILKVIRGGDASEGLQGTWVHERLALKFAAWLSPKFELWVYDRIMQVMQSDSILISGKDKTTYEWLLTKFADNVDEMRILMNLFPGQLPKNIRLDEEE